MPMFTPGPWDAIAPDPSSPCKAVVARDERFHEGTRTICVVTQPTPDMKGSIPHRRNDEPDDCETGEEDLANTNLIAAAPDLYEALKVLISWHEGELDDLTDVYLDKARLALAKAVPTNSARVEPLPQTGQGGKQ